MDEEIIRQREKIVKKLIKRRRMKELEELLNYVEGRHNLRCFPFNNVESKCQTVRFKDSTYEIVQKTSYKKVKFDSYDFSHADFNHTIWDYVKFNNCLFDKTRIFNAIFSGCTFSNSTFIDCELTHTLLGGSKPLDYGLFINTIFRGGSINSCHFDYPLFKKCIFECNISDVNFGGTQFVDCTFTGRLNEVIFHGYSKPGTSNSLFRNMDIPRNDMLNVDFSQAYFDGYSFLGGIEFTNIALPKSNRLLLIKKGPKVMNLVRNTIENEWDGEDKRIGLRCIDIESEKIFGGQTQLLHSVDENSKHYGESFAMKLASLIIQTQQRVNKEDDG